MGRLFAVLSRAGTGVLLVAALACGRAPMGEAAASAGSAPREEYGYEASMPEPAAPVTDTDASPEDPSAYLGLGSPATASGQVNLPLPAPAGENPEPKRAPLLIYDAELTLAVFETNRLLGEIEALTRAKGGYLVQRSDDSIKVRIPADSFPSTLEEFSKLGDELHRTVSVRDVTEEFADLEGRLRAMRAVQRRLEALLERANDTNAALAVERELQRVTSEMEGLLGRLKVLSELVRFSTITVRFQARAVDEVGREHRLPFPWLGRLGLGNLLTLE